MNISKVQSVFDKYDVPELERKEALEGPTPGNYDNAIRFLGAVTLALALGAVLLPAFEKEVAEALWGALGAGIGGLAGIFMGNKD